MTEWYAKHKKSGEKYRVILINLLAEKVLVAEMTDSADFTDGKTIFFNINQIEFLMDGETSDGNHTFNELYEHRLHLFAALCNLFSEKAWKSKQHEDGTMYEDHFIVGIATPAGDFSYHYHVDHWPLFEVRELERAPKWDGHVAKDVVRLRTLITNA